VHKAQLAPKAQPVLKVCREYKADKAYRAYKAHKV
jgi:hypothetical protein